IIFYLHKRKKEKEQKRINDYPDFLLKLESKIKTYKPYKKFSKEEPYQI
ncbi:hypothetical protein HOK00_06525, partial [bacterium]|nr:hypothetical protein [bacterium]